jgi:CO/xanthine dehydrogenase FAD-binding subunit
MRWGLQKMTRRQGDFALVGVAVVADVDAQGQCRRVSIVVNGAADYAQQVPKAQGVLTGQTTTHARVRDAARAAANEIETRSDIHASAAYRTELIEALVQRALTQAFADVLPAASRAA